MVVSMAVVALTLVVAVAALLTSEAAALVRRAPVLESGAGEVELASATHASPAEFRTLQPDLRTSSRLIRPGNL